jgi:hypothetical protein
MLFRSFRALVVAIAAPPDELASLARFGISCSDKMGADCAEPTGFVADHADRTRTFTSSLPFTI